MSKSLTKISIRNDKSIYWFAGQSGDTLKYGNEVLFESNNHDVINSIDGAIRLIESHDMGIVINHDSVIKNHEYSVELDSSVIHFGCVLTARNFFIALKRIRAVLAFNEAI